MEETGRAGLDPWLVLFVALVGIFLPILYLFTWYQGVQFQFAIAASRGAEAPPLGVLLQSAFPYPIRLALCAFIAWRMLWVRTPRTPLICAVALAALLIGVPVLEIGVAELILPMPGAMLLGWAGPVLSRGCFFAFCGAWFLLKSSAVERNYGVTSEAREIFE